MAVKMRLFLPHVVFEIKKLHTHTSFAWVDLMPVLLVREQNNYEVRKKGRLFYGMRQLPRVIKSPHLKDRHCWLDFTVKKESMKYDGSAL